MKRLLKLIGLLLLVFIAICAFSWLTDKSNYGSWVIEKRSKNDTGLSWIKFLWIGDSLGKRYYERVAMNVPVKISGIPYDFTFQFDLGDDHTEIYENSLNDVYAVNPTIKNKVKRLRSIFQFWNSNKSYKNIDIEAGDYIFKNPDCYVHRNFGNEIDKERIMMNRPLHIGSIGVDLFQNKVLIIDYPRQQFCIADSVPANYNVNMIPIKLNNAGMALLPMKLNGKTYDCLFDNGSSIFPLIGSLTRIDEYSKAPDNDTIATPSWGLIHDMTGRKIPGIAELGGQKFTDVEIYADHRKDRQEAALADPSYLIAGNALFWDKTVIIDFKHKAFGVK